MVYIVNTNINQKKKVFNALSQIFGLGKSSMSTNL